MKSITLASLLAGFAAAPAFAASLGSVTVSGDHWAYSGSGQAAAANNTKTTLAPMTGIAKTIHITGKIITSQAATYPRSIRVQPSGAGMAAGAQPWFQFSYQLSTPVNTAINVDTWAYIPHNGLDLSKQITFENFSIDSEAYTPGKDATSSLTYEFDNAFAPGTVEFGGTLATTDPKFSKRPWQVSSSAASGFGTRFFLSGTPHYDVQPFYVSTTGRYDLASANEFEGSLALYQNGFDPTITTDAYAASNIVGVRDADNGGANNVIRDTSFNALPVNDDASGGSTLTATLTAGRQYFFVTTAAFSPADGETDGGPFVGRYSNLITPVGITGTATLGLVPEPTTIAAGLAATALLTRRRR